jgi:hypothetical protein
VIRAFGAHGHEETSSSFRGRLNSCIVCLYTRRRLMDASLMLVLLRGELNEISAP